MEYGLNVPAGMLRDLLASVRDRMADLDVLADTVWERYERVPDRTAVVRTNEVAEYVAGRLGVENSPWFRQDMLEAMKRAEMRTTLTNNVRRYLGLRERSEARRG